MKAESKLMACGELVNWFRDWPECVERMKAKDAARKMNATHSDTKNGTDDVKDVKDDEKEIRSFFRQGWK